MRYFVNLNSGHTFALPETDSENFAVQSQYELLEISKDQFLQVLKGDKDALASVPVNRR